MLREIPANVLPARGAASSDKKTPSVLKAASAQALPSSESEDLEDFSSSDNDDQLPARGAAASIPRGNLRRLVRLGDRNQPGSTHQDDHALEDDILTGLTKLGLGSSSPTTSAVNEQHDSGRKAKPSATAAIPAAAEGSGEGDEGDAVDGVVDSEEGAESDEGYEPFFERLAPAVKPKGAPTARASEAPGPGSLVLGQKQQYVLPAPTAKKLYPHQVQGVKWLFNLFDMQRGGILGDDMGLGKTMQCSAFLAGLFNSGLVRRAIIIAPKTLLPHWIKELGVCGLKGLTREFFGNSESERTSALRSVVRGSGIIVTTYGMVQHNAEQLAGPAHSRADEDFNWDVMFLDEGHKIKNPKMKLVEQLRKLPARVRVIISGTPIQNNLMEMHSLFDFTTEGLLGDAKTFKKNYERPITKGLDKEACARERQMGAAIAAELRQRVEPFFLRREKKDVLRGGDNGGGSAGGSSSTAGSGGAEGAGPSAAASAAPAVGQRATSLPRKNDLVVWLRLTQLQRKIYTSFLHTDSVRQVLNEKASPLAAITVLKKICDHPALLTQRTASSVITGAHRWASNDNNKGGYKSNRKPGRRNSLDDFIVDDSDEPESIEDSEDDDPEEVSDSGSERRTSSKDESAEDAPIEWLGDGEALAGELARELERRGADASCKTAFVLALLEQLHAEGHRTLIFSQSKVMLSILEAGVKTMKMAYCRIDGDVSSAEERQALVNRFQTNDKIPVFLLTSQVGGLGLTLTAADRVIIVDPAWNPSVDNQSVDRAYRLGQTRDVVVYRLITCGTVEEKIYRKQVYKGGLLKTGTEEGIQFRYFTQTELRDLFSVTPEGLQESATQVQLHGMHAHQRDATEELQRHLERVRRMESVAGIHDHNLLFSQRPEEPVPTAQEGAAILSQMQKAGPIGVDALTNMMQSGMKISSSSASMKQRAAVDQARRKVEELATRIQTTQGTLKAALAMRMPDGGAKLKESLVILERQHQVAVAELKALEADGAVASDLAGSSGSSASGGSGLFSRFAMGGSNNATGAFAGTSSSNTGSGGSSPATSISSAGASGPGHGFVQAPLARPAGRLGGLGFGAGLMARANRGGGSGAAGAAGGDGAPRPVAGLQQPSGEAGRQRTAIETTGGSRGPDGNTIPQGAPVQPARVEKVTVDDEENSFFSAGSLGGQEAYDDAVSQPASSPIDLTGSPDR
ncbi:hypothetical protein Agub_g1691 [Astrephomene gubernaculifera]|uniref:Uncharacterized protein n=1 Tax=Astrephomene gubernaculifera TaxID=47775 RepID=A0AAD3DI14_9CHLO|nr:hypothetical protein Agub_g1691 [Astrephomene gubernaculifera]